MFDEENDITEEEKKDRDKIRTVTGHATAESANGSAFCTQNRPPTQSANHYCNLPAVRILSV